MEIVVRNWKGLPIRRRTADGYFDATAMCKAACNWKFYEYQRSARGAAYIAALQEVLKDVQIVDFQLNLST